MTRTLRLVTLAAFFILSSALIAHAADGQSKTGTIKSVDAAAKSFVVKLDPRDLTITVNDKTTYTLDAKDSTFTDAVKTGNKVSVTYTKEGESRVASKVEATTAAAKKETK